MKQEFSILTFIFFILFCNTHESFSQKINWVKQDSFVDKGWLFGVSTSADENGNIYTGSVYRNDGGNTSPGSFISKYSAAGELIWEKYYQSMTVNEVASDRKGNLYLTGSYTGSLENSCGSTIQEHPEDNFFLMKLSPAGNCLWVERANNSWGTSVAVDADGRAVYVIGTNLNNSVFSSCGPLNTWKQFVGKYDSNGNCEWMNSVINQQYISGVAVSNKQVATTGNFSFTAYFGPDSSAFSLGNSEINNVYTAQYDLGGQLQWAQLTADTDYGAESASIAIDENENIYLYGTFYDKGFIGGQYFEKMAWQDVFLVKYDKNGKVIKVVTGRGPDIEYGRAIHAAYDGLYFSGEALTEITFGDNETIKTGGQKSLFIGKMNFDLEIQWYKLFKLDGAHAEIFSIGSEGNGNVVVYGDFDGKLTVGDTTLVYDNWIYKRPFLVSIKDTSFKTISNPTEQQPQALSIHPNPNHGTFTLEGDIIGADIEIIDHTGRRVRKYNNIKEQTLQVSVPGAASGIFYLRIIKGEALEVKKVVIE